jgi:hypothetical protein
MSQFRFQALNHGNTQTNWKMYILILPKNLSLAGEGIILDKS